MHEKRLGKTLNSSEKYAINTGKINQGNIDWRIKEKYQNVTPPLHSNKTIQTNTTNLAAIKQNQLVDKIVVLRPIKPSSVKKPLSQTNLRFNYDVLGKGLF